MSAALDITHEHTSFADHAEWTGAHARDRNAWLKTRSRMITASDVAAILGEDTWRSPLDVYVDKISEPRDEVLTLSDPRFWGLVLEQPVLRAVAAYHGWKYRSGGALLRSRKHPHIGATLDAEIDRGQGWIPFEGKTTRIPKDWDEEEGQLPTRVLIQAQVQLLVTGAPVNVVFALLQGSRPCQVEVHPIPEFHSLIVEEGERFMARVRELDPPPPMEGRDEREALKRLYPKDDGAIVDLPDDAVAWTREYQELGTKLKSLETRKDHLGDLIRASIGDATYGVLPEPIGGKTVWRCKLQQRAGYSVAPVEFRQLLAMKEIK